MEKGKPDRVVRGMDRVDDAAVEEELSIIAPPEEMEGKTRERIAKKPERRQNREQVAQSAQAEEKSRRFFFVKPLRTQGLFSPSAQPMARFLSIWCFIVLPLAR